MSWESIYGQSWATFQAHRDQRRALLGTRMKGQHSRHTYGSEYIDAPNWDGQMINDRALSMTPVVTTRWRTV